MNTLLFLIGEEIGSEQCIATFSKEFVEDVRNVIFYCIDWRNSGFRRKQTIIYYFVRIINSLFLLGEESGSQQSIATFSKKVVEEVGNVIFYCIHCRTNGSRKTITCLL